MNLDPFFSANIWTDTHLSDIHLTEDGQVYVRDPSTKLLPVTGLKWPGREALLVWLNQCIGDAALQSYLRRLVNKEECDFSLNHLGCRWRAHWFIAEPQRWKLVLRRISPTIPRLEDLGLPPSARNLINNSKGMVLVCGGTGQGKSTTLAAFVDYINTHRQQHIITIEDPLEYVHENKHSLITHREVGQHTASFAASLKSAVRQDPDVIVVGELRDAESVSIALDASNTGHLVLATIHSNAAHLVLERMLSFYTDEKRHAIQKLMSAALRGVICQNILPSQDRRARLLACEVLINTPGVRPAIAEGKITQIPNQMQLGLKEGQLALNAHLVELVRAGRIHRDDALGVAYDVQELTKMLGGSPPPAGGPR